MSRILITGSTDGIGRATAASLLDQRNEVVVHARTDARLAAVQELLDRGAVAVVGDLAESSEVHDLVEQANALGRFDAVIHNAGTMDTSLLLPVNVVAPYLLTAGLERPRRLIYLSSSMHHSGRPDVASLATRGGRRPAASYSDSKLFVTTLMAAVARLWPDVLSHAVDPGWVPTKMGGSGASDDLRLAHVTQTWLSTSHHPDAVVSGRYWFHMRQQEPHPAVIDESFQTALLASLADATGITLSR